MDAIRKTISLAQEQEASSGHLSKILRDEIPNLHGAIRLPDDSAADDEFGRSVAISGTTAIVGAYQDDDNGSESGSAYLFDTTTGTQIAKLLPSDGAPEDDFGRSVSISGNTAIVGANKDDDNGSASGSAYLFDANTGAEAWRFYTAAGSDDPGGQTWGDLPTERRGHVSPWGIPAATTRSWVWSTGRSRRRSRGWLRVVG